MNKVFLTQKKEMIINNREDVAIYRICSKEKETYIILGSDFEKAKEEIHEVISDYQIIETLSKVPQFKSIKPQI